MEFIVEGEPQGKARPRFSRKTGTIYTPAKTAKYEKQIRKAFFLSVGKSFRLIAMLALLLMPISKFRSHIRKVSGWPASITSIGRRRNRI